MGYKKFTPAQKRAYFEKKNREAGEQLERARQNFKPIENPSVYQVKIFDRIANANNCCVVDAVAGAGKTTTILNGLSYIPQGKSACFCAFGRDIADELKERCPVEGVEIDTTHSFGSRAVKKRWRYIRLDKYKLKNKVIERLGDPHANPEEVNEELEERIEQVCKATSFSKNFLAHDSSSVTKLVEDYNLEFLTEQESKRKLAEDEIETRLNEFVSLVLEMQNLCKEDTTTFDFDDMLWFPVVYNLPLDQFDIVFVDETQDLNKCQMALVKKMMRSGGRIIAVGDERQAIYLFRGADQHSMANLVEEFNAERLPLSVTYRCAKNIVKYVKDNVNGMEHLQAAETSPDGEVKESTYDDLVKNAKAGDFIVSRLNAPNMTLAMHLLSNNIRCNIRGKDLGGYFKYFIKRSKSKNLAEFQDFVTEWQDNQIQLLTERKKKPADLQARIENIQDRGACMLELANGCQSLSEMLNKINALFTDADEKNLIILGTTHKLKGLERDTVWLLHSTFKPGKDVEEDNLFYVAATRAKRTLNVVKGQLRDKKE
jgi:superfamily I DNA/RNA helicase